MGQFTVAGENLVLTDFDAAEDFFVSLHTGFPATALNEVTGGAPAYARVAITWDPPVGGNMDSNNQPVLNVPGGITIEAVALNTDAAGAGTIIADHELPAPVVISVQGTVRVADADILTP